MTASRQDILLYRMIGSRIRSLRRTKYTQEELANLIGVSRTSITNLESGRQRAPVHLILRIAAALGCEVADLLPRRADVGNSTSSDPQQSLLVVGRITPAVSEIITKYTLPEGKDGRSR
jgi:transcriptional regulator with XRE-family HTH domain